MREIRDDKSCPIDFCDDLVVDFVEEMFFIYYHRIVTSVLNRWLNSFFKNGIQGYIEPSGHERLGRYYNDGLQISKTRVSFNCYNKGDRSFVRLF